MTERPGPGTTRPRVGVERQVQLPIRQALTISARSIRNRIGRTIVSMSAILLGITFLIATVASNKLAEAVTTQQAGVTGARPVSPGDLVEQQQQQIWLVSIALLVAGIGITNAMLMSVTERFREIGTMKCLGALDRFIVEILLFETAFLGLIGSAIGCVFGTAVSLVLAAIEYGPGAAATAMGSTFGSLIGWYGAAIVLGLVLSVLAAIYPAMRATKMVPADAMRADI